MFLLKFISYNILEVFVLLFFFNDPATTEIYTLSLHDALPILVEGDTEYNMFEKKELDWAGSPLSILPIDALPRLKENQQDRKSTRLNSSHQIISYAVFCLKKKKKEIIISSTRNTFLNKAKV